MDFVAAGQDPAIQTVADPEKAAQTSDEEDNDVAHIHPDAKMIFGMHRPWLRRRELVICDL